jgi:hypothetical protein
MFEERTITAEKRAENEAFVEQVKSHTDGLKKPLDGSDAKQAVMKVFAMKRRSQYGR